MCRTRWELLPVLNRQDKANVAGFASGTGHQITGGVLARKRRETRGAADRARRDQHWIGRRATIWTRVAC